MLHLNARKGTREQSTHTVSFNKYFEEVDFVFHERIINFSEKINLKDTEQISF